MPYDLLTQIRQRQQRRLKTVPGTEPLQEHAPEMLYIGCVDARLDPVADIGINQGKALIYRNIGALVPPPHAQHKGRQHENESVGAVLEFFLNHIKLEKGKTKHIVISGHTHCGGVHYACKHNLKGEEGDSFLPRYLALLTDAVKNIFGIEKPEVNDDAAMRRVEHESVRRSIENLMQYDVVKEALKKGEVQIHGWVIDTATQCIEELKRDEKGELTDKFEFMADHHRARIGRS